MMKYIRDILIQLLLFIFLLNLSACLNKKSSKEKPAVSSVPCRSDSETTSVISKTAGDFIAYKAKSPVQIDGCSKDSIWSKLDWFDMNYVWMGDKVASEDYQGKFKLAWDSQFLYVLVEVTDDYLHPTLEDGLENYWKGDYVEVFIDEDKSGGNHQFNHQAFAYHVSTEGHAIDKSTTQETVFFDDHIVVERTQDGNSHLWELAIKLYDKQFDENALDNEPVRIVNQKQIGFSIAYGDNDGNSSRENFMGSKMTHGLNNDEGYVNSNVFGSILFVE